MNCKNKVVLITGAGKGAGRLLAQAFAERGASVAANDISPVNVEQVVDQINALGGRAKAYIEDVAKKLGAQYIINQVEEDFGQIDILVNHAAVEPHVPLLEIDEWDWHRVLDVNLTGTFLMTQSVGRLMRAQGGRHDRQPDHYNTDLGCPRSQSRRGLCRHDERVGRIHASGRS